MAGFIDKYGYRDGPGGRTRPATTETVPTPRARVDVAATTDENRKHWGNADGLGPNAATNHGVRVACRNRGRYEDLNNSYCRGLTRSRAYDLIGKGPRLQLSLPDDDSGDLARGVERKQGRWARAAHLPAKWRLMDRASSVSGGCFALLDSNARLPNPVQLDVRLVEVDQCLTPWQMIGPKMFDGIRVDDFGNPVEYFFLKYHPGEMLTAAGAIFDLTHFIRVPAEQVLHWCEIDRPGQLHGLPRITSALPLFAQLRRIRLATLTAMEFAAMIAGVMKTNVPPVGDGGPMPVDDWSLFELVRGALLSLPEGWSAEQFKSEHPNATFEMLQGEILGEAGRGVGTPRNIVLGTSKDLNFSSGRLDHLPYHRALDIERDDFRTVVLDPVLLAWEQEARMVGELDGVPPVDAWEWDWLWDSFDSIDPLKDAQADDVRVKNGTTTLKAIVGDPEAHFDQLARERAYAESVGVPWPPAAGASAPSTPTDPQSPEQAVAMALESVGVGEAKAAEIMDALAPTFAAFRPRINGHRRRNGYPVAGGMS